VCGLDGLLARLAFGLLAGELVGLLAGGKLLGLAPGGKFLGLAMGGKFLGLAAGGKFLGLAMGGKFLGLAMGGLFVSLPAHCQLFGVFLLALAGLAPCLVLRLLAGHIELGLVLALFLGLPLLCLQVRLSFLGLPLPRQPCLFFLRLPLPRLRLRLLIGLLLPERELRGPATRLNGLVRLLPGQRQRLLLFAPPRLFLLGSILLRRRLLFASGVGVLFNDGLDSVAASLVSALLCGKPVGGFLGCLRRLWQRDGKSLVPGLFLHDNGRFHPFVWRRLRQRPDTLARRRALAPGR
jgi:hypothetical protein